MSSVVEIPAVRGTSVYLERREEEQEERVVSVGNLGPYHGMHKYFNISLSILT